MPKSTPRPINNIANATDIRLKLFTNNRSKKILQVKDGFEMCADSDLFTIKMDFSKHRNIGGADKIRKAIALARKIYRILKN